jgi:hypothetical protein
LYQITNGAVGDWPEVLILIDVTLGPDAIEVIRRVWEAAALPRGATTTACTQASRATTGTHPPGGRGVESLGFQTSVPQCQGGVFRHVPE